MYKLFSNSARLRGLTYGKTYIFTYVYEFLEEPFMKLQEVSARQGTYKSYLIYVPSKLVKDVLIWKKGDVIDYTIEYEKGSPILKLRKLRRNTKPKKATE